MALVAGFITLLAFTPLPACQRATIPDSPSPDDTESEDTDTDADTDTDTDSDHVPPEPVYIEGTWKDVSVTNGETCAVTEDGRVRCWGHWDQLEIGLPEGTGFHSISVGGNHTACALDSGGHPYCWGQLAGVPAPAEPMSALSVAHRVACGILESDGSLACWSPDPLEGAPPTGAFTDMSLGSFGEFGCALERGSGLLRCWGDIPQRDEPAPEYFPPVNQGPYTEVSLSIGATVDGCVLLATTGEAQCWSSYWAGPWTTEPLHGLEVVDSEACAIGADDLPVCWWRLPSPQTEPPPVPIRRIALDSRHACAITMDSRLLCWWNAPVP